MLLMCIGFGFALVWDELCSPVFISGEFREEICLIYFSYFDIQIPSNRIGIRLPTVYKLVWDIVLFVYTMGSVSSLYSAVREPSPQQRTHILISFLLCLIDLLLMVERRRTWYLSGSKILEMLSCVSCINLMYIKDKK